MRPRPGFAISRPKPQRPAPSTPEAEAVRLLDSGPFTGLTRWVVAFFADRLPVQTPEVMLVFRLHRFRVFRFESRERICKIERIHHIILKNGR